MIFKLILFFTMFWGSVGLGADSAPVTTVKITNGNEDKVSDVELINGKNRLLTSSIVTIEQLFGRDNASTTWFYIGTDVDADGVGSAGDTVRVQIPAANTPLNLVYPAVDNTTTVSSACVSDPKPERCLALDICTNLNADGNFNGAWKCEVIKDFSGVFISSRIFNEWSERTSWTVTATGTTIVTKAFDDIIRRGFSTELSRSPNNPRSGVLAIAGTVTTTPGSIGDRFFSYFFNTETTPSNDMQVNCSTYSAPLCDFIVNSIPNSRILVEYISCFGSGNGIQFGNFLSKNSALTNGVEIFIRSEGTEFTFEPIRLTEDWKNLFSSQAGTDFRLDIQSGADAFVAQFRPTVPFPIEPTGTVIGGDDYLRVRIQDNLATGLSAFQCAVFGFEEEP